jgi:triosephosphate isomerase
MIYLIANWKMNHTVDSARNFLATVREAISSVKGVEVVICPPFPLIPAVRAELMGTPIKVGAQNISSEEEGALTGEVSGKQLEGLVDYVIVGHSERKKYFHETSKDIAEKLVQSYRHDLKPILCFEKLEELAVVNETDNLILTYEPTFAIGTGHPDTPDNAAAVASQAKAALKVDLPVLYGGSVTADNIKEFLVKKELAGALVGGASLDAGSFVNLVNAAVK